MKKLKLVVLLAMTIVLLVTGCIDMKPVSEFETEDAIFTLRNGVIEVKAAKDLLGVDVFLKADIAQDDVIITKEKVIKIVMPYMDGTVVAAAIGEGYFAAGEAVMSINGNFDDLKKLAIDTQSTVYDSSFEPQVMIPVDGVYVQDTWALPGTSGSFVIGARNIGDGRPIAGFALDLAFVTDDIEVTSIERILPAELMQTDFTSYDNAEGTVLIDFAFKRGNETPIGNEPLDLYRVHFMAKETYALHSEVWFTNAVFTWLDPEQDWQPIVIPVDDHSGYIVIAEPTLLGDFNYDGEVDDIDLALFAPNYRKEYDLDEEPLPDLALYDIAPARKAHGDPWAHIFTEADRDGIINVLDLVIFAQNFDFGRPQLDTTFVKTLEELDAAIMGDMNPIVFGADITGTPVDIERLVDINLNGYTLYGSLSFDTGDAGLIELFAGTIDGDLTVDAPNATFNNFAEVKGTITVNGIVQNSWNEYFCSDGDGNNLLWNAAARTLNVFGCIESITFSADANVTGGASIKNAIIEDGVEVTFDEPPQNAKVPAGNVWNPRTGMFYTVIQAAIDAADAGDTLFVGAGTYAEDISVGKALMLLGTNASIPGDAVREPEATIEGPVLVNADNVTVTGFFIDGSNVDQGPALKKRGILVGNTASQSNIDVKNNIIKNWVTGISLAGGGSFPWNEHVHIEGNLLVNNGIGSTENVNQLTVINNAFDSGAIGLGGGAVLSVAVTGNSFQNGTRYIGVAAGVDLIESFDDLLIDNTFDKAVSVDNVQGKWYNRAVYSTITQAVDEAAEGASVEVLSGTYIENVFLTKSLELKTQGSATIEGGVELNANNITLQGFKILEGGILSGNQKAGIYICGGTSGHRVMDNEIVGRGRGEVGWPGIMFGYNTSDIHIRRNTIYNWYQGIYVNPSGNIWFEDNTIRDNFVGIGSDGLYDVLAENNSFLNNELEGWGSSDVGNNVVARNNKFVGTGVIVYDPGCIDAKYNWWGDPTGPQPFGDGASTGGCVFVEPWWKDEEMTELGYIHSVINIDLERSYPTIQEAIDDAEPGNTVEVLPGTYEENIVIDKAGLRLESKEQYQATIVNQVETPSVSAVRVEAGGAVFDGFVVQGVSPGHNQEIIEIAAGVFDTVLRNLRVESPGFTGAQTGHPAIGAEAGGAAGTIMINNVISERTIGLRMMDGAWLFIEDVTVTKSGDGAEAIWITGPGWGDANIELSIENVEPLQNADVTGSTTDIKIHGLPNKVNDVEPTDANHAANLIFDENADVDEVRIDGTVIKRTP